MSGLRGSSRQGVKGKHSGLVTHLPRIFSLVKKHWPEVAAAMQKELETWAKLKCSSRNSGQGSRNIIDVRWVHKWNTQAATTSAGTYAAVRKIIRSRLCLRGFKDMDKDSVAKYAGTSQRHSQRLLCSEAVLQNKRGRRQK